MDRNFPPATMKAAASGTAGAYSAIFNLLPYLEDTVIYTNVSNNTGKMFQGPFSVGTTPGAASGGAYSGANCSGAPAAVLSNLSYLQCPSSSGGGQVEPALSWSGSSAGSNATDVSLSGTACGRSSYAPMVGAYCLSGTVPSNVAGAIQMLPESSGSQWYGLAGIRVGQVTDGLTKTILFIESREKTYASWIDGSQMWVTALSGTTAAPTLMTESA